LKSVVRDILTKNHFSCPEGWLDSPEGCFHFATDVETKTWDEAVEYCQELGGYLAEVLNEESQRFLVAEATALGESTNWWLGATDQELVSFFLFWYHQSHIQHYQSETNTKVRYQTKHSLVLEI
jgi:hypothetical protein